MTHTTQHMRFLKRKLMKRPDDWRRAVDEYRAHYAQIESALPENVRRFRRLGLHDSPVNSVNWPHAKCLRLVLDEWTVYFLRVRDTDCTDIDPEDDVWLYHEIHLAAGGAFELLIMFSGSECHVIAHDVCVYDNLENRWIIGAAEDIEACKPPAYRKRHAR